MRAFVGVTESLWRNEEQEEPYYSESRRENSDGQILTNILKSFTWKRRRDKGYYLEVELEIAWLFVLK